MRRIYSSAIAIASSIFLLGPQLDTKSIAGEVSAGTSDLGFFVAEDPTKVNSGGNTTSNLYKLLSDGSVTLLKEDIFPDVGTNSFTSSNFAVDEHKGKIYFLEDDRGGGQDRRYRKYDIDNNEFEGYITVTGLPSGAVPINMGVIQKLNDTIEKKCESEDNDCDDSGDENFVSLGGEGENELLRIDDDGISQGGASGKSLVKYVGNELHIGENSWITKEEEGRQKVYAKDANGNPIPIDYTNGTKLLINGRDVEQAIDNGVALASALTGLPTVPQDSKMACGVGTGTHSGNYAFSGGCASKVNERLTMNLAASVVPGQDYQGKVENAWAGRAGFVFKLGKINKPTLISQKEKKALQSKVENLTASNKEMKEANQQIKDQNKELLSRLEKLERIALGHTQSKDLASLTP